MRGCLAAVLLAAASGVTAAPPSYAARYAQVCAACHGAAGHSVLALTPSLGGQPAFYAITQLFLFREGRRDSVAMSAIGLSLNDDDLRGFADHIATLPPPSAPPPGDAARIARGRVLAETHRCGSCHGGDFSGGEQVARLAHQREDYLRATLRGFRAGTRPGYTQAMSEAVAGVSPEQLDDIAHYLAHLPAR